MIKSLEFKVGLIDFNYFKNECTVQESVHNTSKKNLI